MPAVALYGGFAFAVYPVSVAMLMDVLETENMLSGASGLLFLHGVGAALGPALAGQMMGWWGPQALLIYFACMQATLCFFTVWNLHRRFTTPSGDHPAHFVPMVRTTPTALEMLPDEADASSGSDGGPEP